MIVNFLHVDFADSDEQFGIQLHPSYSIETRGRDVLKQKISAVRETHGVSERELVHAVKKSLLAHGVNANSGNKTAPIRSSAEALSPVKVESSVDISKKYQEVRRFLANAVEVGNLDLSLINELLFEDGFLAVEGVLLDYKRDFPADKPSMCKFIKHIAAFHNTYGGYLIIGADEIDKDAAILPFCEIIPPIESKQLRDFCREYLSAPIELQIAVLDFEFHAKKWQVQAIHIPKRGQVDPVSSKKDGAIGKGGKPTFHGGEIFVRDGDNSVIASSPSHFKLIYGSRVNPFLIVDAAAAVISPVEGRLPDRSFICPEFIGRQDVIAQLYRWLSDDFSCVRVLAGEGGLGKTSIAYEFAQEVSRSRLGNIDLIVWMTAKTQQFRALTNSYEEVIDTHFSTSKELFSELAFKLAATKEEVADTSENQLPKLLKNLLKNIRVFAVIDDLDSLDINEQKRCIEVCQQLAGEGSRFLFTTRKNATASSSTAIELQGLSIEDYQKLIASWQLRLKLAPFTEKSVERLYEASKGSPLYTESLLRLIRSGMSPNDAIAAWRGALGIDVRNAALKREVLQLGAEARRSLVTVAILGECSYAEVKQATGFSDQTLVDSFNELQSLFLLYAPEIAGQSRTGISNTTRDLVRSLGPELIPSFSAYEQATKANRFKVKSRSVDVNAVGAAINQALALLAARNPEEALKTVDEVNKKFGGKNYDLLFMRARSLLACNPSRIDEALRSFKQAYAYGQRKALFFQLWFETESQAEHYEIAIEVANDALGAGSGNKSDWLINRAHSRIRSAAAQSKVNDVEHSRMQLVRAANDLVDARKVAPDLEWDNVWKELLYSTHDSLWSLDTREMLEMPPLINALDGQLHAIGRGDTRFDVFVRLPGVLDAMSRVLVGGRDSRSEKENNLMVQSTRQCLAAYKAAPQNLRSMRAFDLACKQIDSYAAEYGV